ncbi:hypothetical protein MRX96_005144 [Rhipicephalus microplus]
MQVAPACRCLGDGAAVRSPWQPPRPPDTRGDSGGRERRRRSERLGEESAGVLSSQSGRCAWEWLPQRACEGTLLAPVFHRPCAPATAKTHGSRLSYSATRGPARRHPSISAAAQGVACRRRRRVRKSLALIGGILWEMSRAVRAGSARWALRLLSALTGAHAKQEGLHAVLYDSRSLARRGADESQAAPSTLISINRLKHPPRPEQLGLSIGINVLLLVVNTARYVLRLLPARRFNLKHAGRASLQ